MRSNRKLKIPRSINRSLMSISFLIIFVLWFWPYKWIDFDNLLKAKFTGLESAIYATANSILWPASWAYIILACSTGNAKNLNRFFSWPGFRPLSRLNFQVYSTHDIIFGHMVGSFRAPFHADMATLVSAQYEWSSKRMLRISFFRYF